MSEQSLSAVPLALLSSSSVSLTPGQSRIPHGNQFSGANLGQPFLPQLQPSPMSEMLKKKKKLELTRYCDCASAAVAWPAIYWRAMADLFLSHGHSDSELHNLSNPAL